MITITQSVRDLRKYLGTVNFVRNYLLKLAHYQDSLNQIGARVSKRDSKTNPIQWTTPLIKDLAKVPNLVIDVVANHVYNPQLPLFLVTDASQKSIGSMLLQTSDNNKGPTIRIFQQSSVSNTMLLCSLGHRITCS